MNIGMPLHTLDIIGTDDNATLRINKSCNGGRGSKEFMLSKREGILTPRGMKIPEDWDTNWDVRLGPIWSPQALPTSEGDITLQCWLLPEYIHPYSSDDSKVYQAEDRTDHDILFTQTTLSKMPDVSAEENGFTGMYFDGSNDYLEGDAESGDDGLDVGTSDFGIFFYLDIGPDNDNISSIFFDGQADTAKDLHVFYRTNVGTENLNFRIDNSGGNVDVSPNSKILLYCERDSGVMKIWVDGTVGWTDDKTNTNSISNSYPVTLGCRQKFGPIYDRHWEGTIYEMIFVKGTVDSNTREKVEGYLAHKYNKLDDLPSGHTYKVDPPRMGAAL
jgi:hypothetical protein